MAFSGDKKQQSKNWTGSDRNKGNGNNQNQSRNQNQNWNQNQNRNQNQNWNKNQNWNQNRNQNQNWNQNQNRRNGNAGEAYIGAPYNFVPFYDKVYEYPEGKLTTHDRMKDGLITGEITYEITAKTPIMIDDGEGKFFKNAQGKHAIPGSTMRGLIRNNVQVLGLCGYDDDIDDYALMYRKVAGRRGDSLLERYMKILGADQIPINHGNETSSISVLKNVRAGYVANEGGKYVIYQTAKEPMKDACGQMNYYVLSEKKIIRNYLKCKEEGTSFSYAFFRQDGKNILQHEFKDFDSYPDRNGRTHYKGTPNQYYRPYYYPVSYEVSPKKDIAAVGKPGVYEKEGYAVSTGKMNEKKAVYIIPKIDKSKSITIPEKDVSAFRIDLKKKENTLKQFGGKEYFDLPAEGKMRPIFYIELGGRLYFGFTPRLRLFYDHTIKDGYKQQFHEGGVDYCKALFGYSSSKKSFKSRLSFSDAVIKDDKGAGEKRQYILAEPKPTSYLDYLVQEPNRHVTYNTENFELRGSKQYWLHKGLVFVGGGVRNQNAASNMSPLAEGATFVGKIRFQNLTEDELGLLLWSVRLEKGSQMNVGKAKSYGYGRISLKINEAKRLDMEAAYGKAGLLELDPFCDIAIDDMILHYKEIVRERTGQPAKELDSIKMFFMMKDANHIPDDSQTRYMSIDKREYQSRTEPLPTVEKIMKKNGENDG